MPKPVKSRPLTIADPVRFRRHAVAALGAYLEGDGEGLIGNIDAALAALHEPPKEQPGTTAQP
jgi:hypothetical protein